LKTLSLSWKL